MAKDESVTPPIADQAWGQFLVAPNSSERLEFNVETLGPRFEEHRRFATKVVRRIVHLPVLAIAGAEYLCVSAAWLAILIT